MQKILLLVFGLFSLQMVAAQTKIDGKIEYDESFNPIVKICLKNDSASKTITTVQVLILYQSSSTDWTKGGYKLLNFRMHFCPYTAHFALKEFCQVGRCSMTL